jgi:oligoendopeptidase F
LAFEYSRLPHDHPRSFAPAGLTFEWPSLEKLFAQLQNREIDSVAALEAWLADESELNSAIFEESSLRYVRNTSQTDNPEYEKAYLEFLEQLEPKIKLSNSELDRKYVSTPSRAELSGFYLLLNRKRENRVSMFRQENVELEKEDSKLAQRYDKIAAAMTVTYQGEEMTLQQMGRFQEVTDRQVRRESWELSEERRLKDAEQLNQIYDDMVGIRHRMAKNAGFDNFRDYIFRKKERFDYTPEDCYRFHEAVEKQFVPLTRDLDRKRRERLALDVLRPWDLLVDQRSRPPLRPFGNADELVQGCERVFGKIDPSLERHFAQMKALNLFDLDSRRGKAPGGYMLEFAVARLPFIFMNSVGRDSDVRVLLHESGHSFHTFMTRDKDFPLLYRPGSMPTEFAEVASTAMELIGGEHLDGTFYGPEDAARSNYEELETHVRLFGWIATIDAFQHWVYTHPGHTREEREDEWAKTFNRFSGLESYEGYEAQLRNRWQKQLHLFEVPFYYIEYGIAGLGALGLWVRYRKEPKETIAAYKYALSLGGSKPLPELFQAAGLPWDFGPRTVEAYAKELRSALSN